MKLQRIDSLLHAIILLVGVCLIPASAWAAAMPCAVNDGGTGMGGTGIVAHGTGMGGTGLKPGNSADTGHLAGRVMFSAGHIEAVGRGGVRRLAKGDPVCVGDSVRSSRSASAQIRMIDNELLAIRPDTKIRIDSYTYHSSSDDNIVLALLKGTCRVITGEIGKRFPKHDLIKTPTATIGVLGTDHEAAVILPGQDGAYPAGTYDKVNTGETYIKTEKGTVDIYPNQVGFVGASDALPKVLRVMPEFYNVPSSTSTPGNAESAGHSAQFRASEARPQMGKSPEQTGNNASKNNDLSVASPGEQIHPNAHGETRLIPRATVQSINQALPGPPSVSEPGISSGALLSPGFGMHHGTGTFDHDEH